MLTATLPDPTGYGRVLWTQDGEVIAIVEEGRDTAQHAISEVNSGVYAFASRHCARRTRRLVPNVQHELYLTDIISISANRPVVRAKHVDDAALVAGVNDRVQLAALGAELNRRIVAAHTRRRHDRRPGHHLDRCRRDYRPRHRRPARNAAAGRHRWRTLPIGPDTTLTDVTVGDEATVIRTHGAESVIGAGAAVGPFAYLRPGTVLGETGKIGAFVETKNSTIGEGLQGPAPDLRRRRRHRRGHQHRRVEHLRQLRRREQDAAPSSARMCEPDPTRCSLHQSTSGTAPTPAPAPSSARMCPRERSRCRRAQRNTDGWVQRKRPGTAAAEAARRARENPSESPDEDACIEAQSWLSRTPATEARNATYNWRESIRPARAHSGHRVD